MTNATRGRWIPWTLAGGFAVVLAANGTLLVLATRTFSGLTTPSPYGEGLRYNAEIAAEHAQAALGWKVRMEAVQPTAGRPALVRFDITGPHDEPVADLTPWAQRRRPSDASLDQELTLAPAGPGSWEGVVSFPLPGSWEIRFIAQHPQGGRVRFRDRLFVSP